MADLIRLDERQVKLAGKVLARAFQYYPSFDHLIPDLEERLIKLPALYEYMVRYGVLFGEAYSTSENIEGIAVWLSYWEAESTEEKVNKSGGKELALILGEEFLERYKPIEHCEQRCHKQYASFDHWYLYPIGVDPIYQGKGYTGRLLRKKLGEIDEQGVPCYLETNEKRNVTLYQHFNFHVVEEGIIPGTKIPYWAMLRKLE